jgi:hypothetical protein
MVLTAYPALSPATNSFCHRRRRIKVLPARLGLAQLRRLDTSNGCQDHTVLPSATAPFVFTRPGRSRETRPAIRKRGLRRCVHRIPPNVRDDGQRPSQEGGMAETYHNFRFSESNIFRPGLEIPISMIPLKKLAFWRRRFGAVGSRTSEMSRCELIKLICPSSGKSVGPPPPPCAEASSCAAAAVSRRWCAMRVSGG